MSIVTIILLILLFILILAKPTYVAIYAENEDGGCGTYFGCCPLVAAVRIKAQFPQDVFILTGKEYDRIAKLFIQEQEEMKK